MGNNKDLLKEVQIINDHAGNDTTKKAQAFSKICNLLANEKDTAHRLIFIKEISKNYGFTLSDLKQAVNALIKKRNAEYKDKEEATTKIDIQEKAIGTNFDVKFNMVNLVFEIIEYETSKNVTDWDILRKLKKANIQITENDLKIILKSNFVQKINPIVEYFELLPPWDGTTDHIKKLTSYIKVYDYDQDRFKTQFKKALIRSIACSLGKAFNKQCFVLVGDGSANQNTGKTSFIRWLTPPDLKQYYLEDLPENSTDGLRVLAENFIINLDELENLWRKERNKLKAVLSKDFVKVRIQYDKIFTIVKRIANFWGSTNENEFLIDFTGNVRWVNFKLATVKKPIDWAYSTDPDTNINKIWAQAYHLYMNGESYQLTAGEIEENEKANNDFLILPPEYDLVMTSYEPAHKYNHDAFYTTTDLLAALIAKSGRNIKMTNINLGRVLRKLGYIQKSSYSTAMETKGNFTVKGYFLKVLDQYERDKQNKHIY